MKYAEIKSGKVVNIIEWDGKSKVKSGKLILATPDAVIGGTYENSKFTRPITPEPVVIPELPEIAALRNLDPSQESGSVKAIIEYLQKRI